MDLKTLCVFFNVLDMHPSLKFIFIFNTNRQCSNPNCHFKYRHVGKHNSA
jgi:hypothetical protein